MNNHGIYIIPTVTCTAIEEVDIATRARKITESLRQHHGDRLLQIIPIEDGVLMLWAGETQKNEGEGK